MSSQMISMAAQFADAAGPLGLSARLAEPSAITLVAIGIAGVVVGRFLLGRN
ncbi:MAG: hypothetical protein VXY04_11110 [Pseudomonadota bacterium]|jgi:hypothetical protein|uniref:Uncharacterized protein n=1 Tax=Qipengyuania flava TaxID=192812 RepID=A0A3T1CDX9_9SPHN|nr:hypothetical protein [Qipengyuania flava]MEC7161380.1 hypothetical protein [Pseudomonadota bacterium]MBW3169498.1 hypothetical protein [Qipengyuania flava]MBY5966736.1 hypothetical protein [Qipengyuania flava]MBY6013060.1 hypothetical protein [Qipengyuania flava]MBY6027502.1 hypothetical protein [Qipengyuania flava]|tara:strand:- start:924 stop:1079 length:156 start_codon:yes stop_codon:yes gene_type:complete